MKKYNPLSIFIAILLFLIVASISEIEVQQLRQYIKQKPNKSVGYINVLNAWNEAEMQKYFKNIPQCYDVMIWTFWIPNNNNKPYATDVLNIFNDAEKHFQTGKGASYWRQFIFENYHQNGQLFFVSAFGDTFSNTFFFNSSILGTQLGDWVNEMQYVDGIDINYEDNLAFSSNPQKTIEWLLEFQTALQNTLIDKTILITHAPQAPYFQKTTNGGKGYYHKLNELLGEKIAWYNIQFYNQQDCHYNDFEMLVENSSQSKCWASNTSIKQLNADGIPNKKIVVGKPTLKEDILQTNTGYIPAKKLSQILNQNQLEIGGFMNWQIHQKSVCRFFDEYYKNINKDNMQPIHNLVKMKEKSESLNDDQQVIKSPENQPMNYNQQTSQANLAGDQIMKPNEQIKQVTNTEKVQKSSSIRNHFIQVIIYLAISLMM